MFWILHLKWKGCDALWGFCTIWHNAPVVLEISLLTQHSHSPSQERLEFKYERYKNRQSGWREQVREGWTGNPVRVATATNQTSHSDWYRLTAGKCITGEVTVTAWASWGFSHFSMLCLLISSLLRPPTCDLQIDLSVPTWRMSQFLKCILRREEACWRSTEAQVYPLWKSLW